MSVLCCRVLWRNIELTAYIFVYEHWCIVELPWDHPATWWFTFLAADHSFYWLHRMAHGMSHIILATTGYSHKMAHGVSHMISATTGYSHNMAHGMSHIISAATRFSHKMAHGM